MSSLISLHKSNFFHSSFFVIAKNINCFKQLYKDYPNLFPIFPHHHLHPFFLIFISLQWCAIRRKSKRANADLPIKVKQTLIVFWIDLGIWEKCEVTRIVFYLNRSKKKRNRMKNFMAWRWWKKRRNKMKKCRPRNWMLYNLI